MNNIILVNKEKGYTSFDVCNKLRRVFNTTQIGHTGTLDPNATGLLMVMVGKTCKVLPYIKHFKKTYVATMKLGIKTKTADIWGEVIDTKEYTMPNKEQVIEVLDSFKGNSKQIPPMTSAIKVNGKKLLELQRLNIEYTPEARDIFIYNIELIELNDEIKFIVECSSGTYIRALVEDIATKLNTIGTMTSLVRTKIDDFDISESYTLEQLINNEYKSMTKEQLLTKYYKTYEYDKVDDIKNGKRINIDSNEETIMITHNNIIIASYIKEKDNIYKCKRGLW